MEKPIQTKLTVIPTSDKFKSDCLDADKDNEKG
jgi:hypothetical protein